MRSEVPGADLVELQTQLLQYRASLFDPETKLPTVPVVLDDVRKMLDEADTLQVLLLCVEQEEGLEATVGWERFDGILRAVANYLQEALVSSRRSPGLLCQDAVRGDRFLIFSERVEAGRLLPLLSAPIPVDEGGGGESGSVTLRVGQGTISPRPARRVERCIYAGIAEADTDLSRRREEVDIARLGELHLLLRERRVTTLFQPIFRFPQRTVVGYEALSRGPEGSYLEPAENLLGFAERAGLLGELEQLCLERALARAHRLPLGSTLFLNLSFKGLEHVESRGPGLGAIVREAGWSPLETVLEITEYTYAENPAEVRRRVQHLREQGFRVAVDDMGTGYSSLNILAELQPDYIKLDRVLIRGLAAEPIKRNLVSALTGFAHASQSLVIAEGVEEQEEVTALQELGVYLIQGFLLGMPKEI